MEKLIVEVYGIGGSLMMGIAVMEKEEEEEIQKLVKNIQPLVIQNLFIAQTFPSKKNLKKIDFKVIKCCYLILECQFMRYLKMYHEAQKQ